MRIIKEKRKQRKNFTVRLSEKERNAAETKALMYCDGNLGEWLRYAIQNCTPRKKDIEIKKGQQKVSPNSI